MLGTLALALVCAVAAPPTRDQLVQVENLIAKGPEKAADAVTALEQLRRDSVGKTYDYHRTYAIWRLGYCHAELLGDLPRARELYAEALDEAVRTKVGLIGYVHRDLGQVYLQLFESEKAIRHLDQAAESLRAATDHTGKKLDVRPWVLLQVDYYRARAELFSGRPEANAEARRRYAKVRQAVAEALPKERADSPDRAELDILMVLTEGDLSNLAARDGDTLGAVATLRAGLLKLEQVHSLRGTQLQLASRLSLTDYYWRLARFEDADRELAAANLLLPRLPGRQNQGDVLQHRATVRLEEARLRLSADPADPRILVLLAQTDAAAREALALADRGSQSPTAFAGHAAFLLAQCHDCRAEVLKAGGKADESRTEYGLARKYADQAVAVFGRVWEPDQPLLVMTRLRRAWILLGLGDTEAARREAETALALFRKRVVRDDKPDPDLWQFYHALVEIEARAGNADRAATHAAEHRRLSARLLPGYLARLTVPEQVNFIRQWDAPALQSCLRLGVGNPTLAERSAEWLINGKARGGELLADIHRAARRADDAGYREYQQLLAQQAALLFGPDAAEAAGRWEATRAAVLDREKRKRDLAAHFPPQAGHEWVDLARVRANLGPKEAFIDLFRFRHGGGDHYAAWVVTAKGPPRVVELGDARDINRLVQTFADRMTAFERDRKRNKTTDDGESRAEKELKSAVLGPLADYLLRPLAAELKDCTAWTISPDDQLWWLPWGVLPVPGSDRYAAEGPNDLTIRYVTSGREVAARPAVARPADGAPWLLADPDFNHRPAGSGWVARTGRVEQLDHAAAEGEEVAAILRSSFKLTPTVVPRTATKDALLALSPPPRYVVLSTHAFLSRPLVGRIDDTILPFDPFLAPGVLFAGYNYRPAEAGGPASVPGLLTAAEILGLDLRGTELAVLSACESGLGKVIRGEGPADLRATFRLAGAKGVVSSLWVVDDVTTRQLVVSMFEGMAPPGGANPATALAKSQRVQMESLRKNRGHAHPFYWAAFTYSGQ